MDVLNPNSIIAYTMKTDSERRRSNFLVTKVTADKYYNHNSIKVLTNVFVKRILFFFAN